MILRTRREQNQEQRFKYNEGAVKQELKNKGLSY